MGYLPGATTATTRTLPIYVKTDVYRQAMLVVKFLSYPRDIRMLPMTELD